MAIPTAFASTLTVPTVSTATVAITTTAASSSFVAATATARIAAASSIATTAATRFTWGAFFFRPRLNHTQRPTTYVCTVERIDRRESFGFNWHIDETKAARAAGFAIQHNSGT